MATPLVPQEVFLLERYSSSPYFARMRDAYARCLDAAEKALFDFTRRLPPDHRARPVSQQPDVVWGEKVLPNMRWTLEGMKSGYLKVLQGQLDGLSMAANVSTTFASIVRDFDWEWMAQAERQQFELGKSEAWLMASNIALTEQSAWEVGDLTSQDGEADRGLLDAPSSWPCYRLNSKTRLKSGDAVGKSGIYLPDADGLCAQLLIENHEAPLATLAETADALAPVKVSQRSVATGWTLVERVADSGGGLPGADDPIRQGVRLRCEGGLPCPRDGWWFAPASVGRQRFRQGELMPVLGSDYGMTIWQFDIEQD